MANDLVLLAQWRERLQRLSLSGMTVEAFCRHEGISASMFYRWQRKLQNHASAATTAPPVDATKTACPLRRKPTPSRRSEIASAGKTTNRPPKDFVRLPVRGVRSMPWIELTLVDGTVIRIPQENHAALGMVLQTLRSEGGERLGEARHA